MKLTAEQRLSAAEHDLVTAAVAEAERNTDAEIVTILAEQSDHYADIPLFWAGGATLLALSVLVSFPDYYQWLLGLFLGHWSGDPGVRDLLLPLFMIAVLKFVSVWLIMQWMPLRLALTPRDLKARRCHARAVDLFRVVVEGRTARRTGILIYLSLREHRVEIVVDAAVANKVAAETWGQMMSGLIHEIREDRPGQGLAQAVRQAGEILAVHVPKQGGNPNELPDRLIEL